MPSRHDWTLPWPQIVAAPAGHHRPLGWVWLPMLMSRGVPQRARPRSRRSAARPSARTEPTATTGKLAERGDRRQPAQVVLPHRDGEAAGRMVQVGERHRRSRARRLPLSDHELARSISDTPPASSKSRRRSGVTPPSGTPCTWTSRPRSATTMVTRRRTAEALTPRPGERLTRERAVAAGIGRRGPGVFRGARRRSTRMPPGSGEEVRIDLFEQEERAAKRPTRRRSRASTVAPIQAFVFAPPTAARLAIVVLPTAAAELAAG